MEKVKITTHYLRRITVGTPRKIADSETPNLQLWIGTTSMAFYLVKKVDGKQYNINLGRWPDITLDEARQAALRRLGALVNYQDMNAPASRNQPTIGDAIDYYISQRNNESTRKSVLSTLSRFAFMRTRKIVSVTHDEIVQVHKNLAATPASANLAVKYLSAAINSLAKKLEIVINNPAAGIKYYPEHPRERFLRPSESPRFFDALFKLQQSPRHSVQADVILMMLYTGARKSNVCHMDLSEITEDGLWIFGQKSIRGKRNEHTIVLGTDELEIIERRRNGRKSGPVFEYRGKPISDIRKTLNRACFMAGITDFVPHDCRRTLGTWMLSNGTPIAVVSKKLGHKSIRITEQVYAHILPDVSVLATTEAIAAMRAGKTDE